VITANDIRALLKMDEIKYLSEMMNFPGVIHGDQAVMQKIQFAHEAGKVIDGHVPGLTGEDLRKYEAAGISTDHECFTMEEALEKISLGMKILIREGSAARNFDELAGLLKTHPTKIMFCSDDKHPNDLIKGHINLLVRRALLAGHDLFDTLRAVTLNPKQHYRLDNGLLQVGDDADFCLVNNLTDLQILQTYIRGVRLADNGKTLLESVGEEPLNRFEADRVMARQLRIRAAASQIKVIKATDGQLITGKLLRKARIVDGFAVANPQQDILKLVCMSRYRKSEPAVAFINGFRFREGAIASTVAHDSHNILAVGTNDDDLLQAIQLLLESKGGISLANGANKMVLPLPVAGIMTNADGYGMAQQYEQLEAAAKKLGGMLASPFMTLSFMALLVIPEIKLSDKGLFDGNAFQFIS
jgi:adenine deaminase